MYKLFEIEIIKKECILMVPDTSAEMHTLFGINLHKLKWVYAP